jgi:hypothetical protein
MAYFNPGKKHKGKAPTKKGAKMKRTGDHPRPKRPEMKKNKGLEHRLADKEM